MKEGNFLILMSVLLICATIIFTSLINHFYPVPDIASLAKQQCIKNNGVPLTDNEGNLIDCRLYKLSFTTPTPYQLFTVTPLVAGSSATPTPAIQTRASSASASAEVSP
jgi:hypothetical protein